MVTDASGCRSRDMSKVCVICDAPLAWPDSRHRVCGGLGPRVVKRERIPVKRFGQVLYFLEGGDPSRESSACALKYRAQQARERRLQGRADRTCLCGQTFTPPRSDGLYCSAACRQRSCRQRKVLRLRREPSAWRWLTSRGGTPPPMAWLNRWATVQLGHHA